MQHNTGSRFSNKTPPLSASEPAGAPSEEVYERINMADDLLGDVLAYLEGEPISKDGVISNLHAYFEARKRR